MDTQDQFDSQKLCTKNHKPNTDIKNLDSILCEERKG